MPSKLPIIFGPIISGVLPHRLRSTLLPFPLSRRLILAYNPMPLKKSSFSTRSGRELQTRSSKSLIDDEAELSDWVSGLSSGGFKNSRLYNGSETDAADGRDNGGFRRREPSTGRPRRENFDSKNRKRGANQTAFSEDRNRKSAVYGRRGNDNDFEGYRKRGKFDGQYRGNERSQGHGFLKDRKQTEKRSEVQFRNGRDSGGGGQAGLNFRKQGRRNFPLTDEEEEEEEEEEVGRVNPYSNFKELIDGEEEEEDDDDDEEAEETERSYEITREESTFPKHSESSFTGNDSYLSESRFDQCAISPLSLKGLKDAGYEKMTSVQEATLPVILKGKDVLAKAKTGTGKTVAFLLPSIEVVVKSPQVAQSEKRQPILVLIICPTRELASQAAAEANTLLKYHPSIGTQVIIGGTRLALEQKRMQANPCQILVATPGRLRDHVENTAGFATRLMGVKVLVLDEADHLLGMGFRKEIERIVAAVPKQRQTLLFSATIPPEVRQICHIALKRDHEFINTVKEGTEDTHSQVRQTHLVAPLDIHFSLLYSLLKDHIADNVNYKVLVFCTTAMVTKLVAELLGELKLNVREIHSRKSQTYRSRVSDEFRKSTGLILVTSDVSARGVDYPDVTLVVQLGVPADKQQYIHRLGRTGRKGKEGEGILLLAPWEEFFLSTVKELPLGKGSAPVLDPETVRKVSRAVSVVEMKTKEDAYRAWLGYYNSNSNVGSDKCRLVELANEFSRSMGLQTPPAIPKLILGKMGLKNVPGLRAK